MRILFCLPTTALSGGVKVIFELANRLSDGDAFKVDIFSFAESPKWFSLKAPLIDAKDVDDIPLENYDLVIVSNAFMLPLFLANPTPCRYVLFCQDYESFHHAQGETFSDFVSDDATFTEIYQLPVPLISSSRAVERLLRERVGRKSFYVRLGLDKTLFYPRLRNEKTGPKRVLLVGNYLMPYKGMRDGFEALRMLSADMDVQLVLVTQESRARAIFAGLPYPVELHFCPADEMPDIMVSCDVYCCTSWYEGLGLPALEAFCCGVPVVSTRTLGVSEYGVDGVNLLLARPNDPRDLYEKLRRLLLDAALANRLRQAAFATVRNAYDWNASVAQFREVLRDIDRTYDHAPEIELQAMHGLLERLEHEGNLTPIAVFRRFRDLCGAWEALCTTMLHEMCPSDDSVRQLARLRDGFRSGLGNENAEYYSAFRAKYDICQLLLGLIAHPRFCEYLKAVTRRSEFEPRTAAAFSEIQYTHR